MFRHLRRGVTPSAAPKSRRRRPTRLLLALGLVAVSLTIMLAIPVITFGPRTPDTRAAAQRAPRQSDPVPVPIRAGGSVVLSLFLGAGLVIGQMRTRSRQSHEATAE